MDLIEKIDSLEISDTAKFRAKDAITTMQEGRRYHIIKTEEYKEYAVLINDQIIVKTKKYNYDGSVAIRKDTPVSLVEFVDYLNERAVEIEETQANIRSL